MGGGSPIDKWAAFKSECVNRSEGTGMLGSVVVTSLGQPQGPDPPRACGDTPSAVNQPESTAVRSSPSYGSTSQHDRHRMGQGTIPPSLTRPGTRGTGCREGRKEPGDSQGQSPRGSSRTGHRGESTASQRFQVLALFPKQRSV